MWMVDSNDHATQELKIPMDGRKLRPLMPRPYSSSMTPPPPPPSPSCSCIRSPNIHLPWTHPISGLSGVGIRREVPLVSTRWNPTPEQLQALEEMYRRGIRTPSAEQIQQIAAKLRRFGKIEGKNVFYWFQNHKARERQKKRRQLELHLAAPKLLHTNTKLTPGPGGLSRRYIEMEHHKKLPTPTEDTASASMQQQHQVAAAAEGSSPPHKIILTAENEASPNNSSLNAHTPTAPHQHTNFTVVPLHIFDDEIKQENRTPTLQLFPIHESARQVETTFEFIEFLPTKNY